MKNKIFIKDWLQFKPYSRHSSTDLYYLRVSNAVVEKLSKKGLLAEIQDLYGKQEVLDFACFITCYLEDLVSDTNFWNTFVSQHKKLFGKPLPFYKTDDYYEQEINPADVAFLTWYYLNSITDEFFIYPSDLTIIKIAENIMDVFEEMWETAPENELLLREFSIEEGESDFYEARLFIDKLLFGSYLFIPDTGERLLIDQIPVVESVDENDPEGYWKVDAFLRESKDEAINKFRTSLLALDGKNWASELMQESDPLRKDYLSISERVTGLFFYKGRDDKNIKLEHIGSGRLFDMTMKSYENYMDFQQMDEIVLIGLVQWRGEWWFSGNSMKYPNEKEIVTSERESYKLKPTLPLNLTQKELALQQLNLQYASFLAFNKNMPIIFLPKEEVSTFIDLFIEFHNFLSSKNGKKAEKTRLKAQEKGYWDISSNLFKNEVDVDDALIFMNKVGGLEVELNVSAAFKLPNNPYYDKFFCEEQTEMLFTIESISTELAKFCVEFCRDTNPFFKEEKGKFYLNDLDFLLRFFKKGNYFTKLNVSIVKG